MKDVYPVFYQTKFGDLPDDVVAVVASHIPGATLAMADAGADWNATDCVTDPRLPFRRLIWAIVINGRMVIQYELGGCGHSVHFAVVSRPSANRSRVVEWAAVGRQPVANFQDFVKQGEAGKLDTWPGFVF